ncbi:MAG: chemotaxis protein CheW [Deltaproteobacteria bacterium]|nr:chemotaxis protein CheW [Deltaproteobacteria bacterium]
MTENDKLLVSLDNETFAVDADAVAAVVETERFFMLPMLKFPFSCPRPVFIKGVITRRGDVVVVIDIGSLLGITASPDRFNQGQAHDTGPYRVAIMKKDASSLGVYLGKKELSFLWSEDLKSLEFEPSGENYIQGLIDPSGRKIKLLDWQRILEETQKAVSCR